MFASETQFVEWLSRLVPARGRGLTLGIGDDAALVRVTHDRDWILTTDLSIEGIHYLHNLHPAASVGHRALARALSDVAAMGGVPRFALVSLALSQEAPRSWLQGLFGGISRLARRCHVAVIGGDTAIVPGPTVIDVVAAGEARKGEALRRSGAHPGDLIFVSGRLGLSALGLCLLKAGSRSRAAWATSALRAHCYPEPQIRLGQFLSRQQLASALIDLSDGLSSDLGRLCRASGVGARIWPERIPVPPIGRARDAHLWDPLQLALHGGEDYQLLFTVPTAKVSRVPSHFHGVPLFQIGEIQQSKKTLLLRAGARPEDLLPAGYDHFRKLLS
jgi:thiamine-monophosphate kinase